MKPEDKTHEQPDVLAAADPGAILIGLRGSLAHGMHVPSEDPDSIDDRDFMGVLVAPREHYIGLTPWGSKGTKETFIGDLDLVEYELRKFIGLLLKGNPNVISLLWLREDQYPLLRSGGRRLLENRELFLSKDMFHCFAGYANEQLKKMGKFERRGFRGKKREELITRYGYDTKNAAHCLRLLRMCIETLETGVVNVDRTGIDAEELLAVKRGAWSQDRVISEARSLQERAKDAFKRSQLPPQPDVKGAEKLCMEIIQEEHGTQD